MKLEFGGYEVEIEAKFKGEDENSKEATMSLLNNISLAYYDSSQHHNKKGHPFTAERDLKKWRDIVKALEAENYFE